MTDGGLWSAYDKGQPAYLKPASSRMRNDADVARVQRAFDDGLKFVADAPDKLIPRPLKLRLSGALAEAMKEANVVPEDITRISPSIKRKLQPAVNNARLVVSEVMEAHYDQQSELKPHEKEEIDARITRAFQAADQAVKSINSPRR